MTQIIRDVARNVDRDHEKARVLQNKQAEGSTHQTNRRQHTPNKQKAADSRQQSCGKRVLTCTATRANASRANMASTWPTTRAWHSDGYGFTA
jgi:hypothetical protein